MNKETKVIVLGADHHNTLAVIRCLGQQKVPFELVVTSSKRKEDIKVGKSRYSLKYTVVQENEEDIISTLLDLKNPEEKKAIIPCTDFTALVIDLNASALLDYYILPGFQENYGKVAFLMDKYNQKLLADEYGIPMAKSWKCGLINGHFTLPSDLVCPCIIKPLVSAYGCKNDIIIANHEEEVNNALVEFESKKYKEIIIQEFLIKEFECCAYGCIVQNRNKYYGGIVRKLREFPPNGGGSLTYAKFIQDKRINELLKKIQDMLWKEKYSGLYDIELLVCKNGIYLNEINFRHSGNGYALIKNGIPAPYIWYIAAVGKETCSFPRTVNKETFHMDEINEVTHLKANNVSIFKFLWSVLHTKAFSVFSFKDIPGTFAFYYPFLLRAKRKCLHIFRR